MTIEESNLSKIFKGKLKLKKLTKKDYELINKRCEEIKELLDKQRYIDYDLLNKPMDI